MFNKIVSTRSFSLYPLEVIPLHSAEGDLLGHVFKDPGWISKLINHMSSLTNIDDMLAFINSELEKIYSLSFSSISIVKFSDDRSQGTLLSQADFVDDYIPQHRYHVPFDLSPMYGTYLETLAADPQNILVITRKDLIHEAAIRLHSSPEHIEEMVLNKQMEVIPGLPYMISKGLKEGARSMLRLFFSLGEAYYMLVLSGKQSKPDYGLTDDKYSKLHFLVTLLTPALVKQTRISSAEERLKEEEILLNQIMVSIMAKLTALRDNETELHAQRVRMIGEIIIKDLIATDFKNVMVSADEYENLTNLGAKYTSLALMLHDLGKVGIPDQILQKTEKLSGADWALLNKHPEAGARVIDEVLLEFEGINTRPFLKSYLATIRQIILSHHEKYDGTGYPYGLSGTQIPLIARIAALVDVYDALRNPRPYKPAFSMAKSEEIISKSLGEHFDPNLARIFFKLIHEIEAIEERYGDAQKTPNNIFPHFFL